MKRSGQYLLVCLLLLSTLPLLAARPMQQGSQGVIQSPQSNAIVRGTVTIMGSATLPDFQFYKVEWGRGANPPTDGWQLIGGSTVPTPVVNGALVQWDTTTVPDGVYTLRLHVVKMDGNYLEFYARQIVVANKRPTETPTLEVTQVSAESTPTLMGPAGPTATLAIVQPTSIIAAPTLTPTPQRIRGNALPTLNLPAWRQSMCWGAGVMAAICVVIGVVFGLRRAL